MSKAPEPPPLDAVIEAEAVLRELRCLDSQDALTPLGKILAKLPIGIFFKLCYGNNFIPCITFLGRFSEPRLGKMLVLGSLLKVGDALVCMAAHSSTFPEIFSLEQGKRRLSMHQRNLAGDRYSDYIAMLVAYQVIIVYLISL